MNCYVISFEGKSTKRHKLAIVQSPEMLISSIFLFTLAAAGSLTINCNVVCPTSIASTVTQQLLLSYTSEVQYPRIALGSLLFSDATGINSQIFALNFTWASTFSSNFSSNQSLSFIPASIGNFSSLLIKVQYTEKNFDGVSAAMSQIKGPAFIISSSNSSTGSNGSPQTYVIRSSTSPRGTIFLVFLCILVLLF